MTNFRLLQTNYNTAAFNMALDEVILNDVADGNAMPTLRFYRWKPSAVSIGYFQSLESEVDVEKCKEMGIDIVRRQTGGGAVFHDDEITYSIHIPLSLKLVPDIILESYAKICSGITLGLQYIGIESQFAPLNDIVVPPLMQKISGNAQTRKRGVILQHGTILRSVDVDKMFEILKVPDEKMKGKLISDVKQRVTSIGAHLTYEKIVEALIVGFQQAFSSANFQTDSLTAAENKRATDLAIQKYATTTWNYQR